MKIVDQTVLLHENLHPVIVDLGMQSCAELRQVRELVDADQSMLAISLLLLQREGSEL